MGLKTELDNFCHYRNAYLLAASAATGSIFFGWDIGLIGGIISLPSFQSYFGVKKKSAAEQAAFNGNIVSVLQVGCLFGALLTSQLAAKFGRKPCLLASGVIYLVGSLLQTVSGLGSSPETGLKVLFFSRFIGGIGVGMVSALVPSYISECTPRAIRGRCTGIIQLANNTGIMLSFWVNYGSSKNIPFGEMQWRMPFAAQLVPGVIFVVLMAFQPESPRWLIEHDQYDRAASTLAFVARTTVDDKAVLVTMDEIKADFIGRHQLTIFQQIKKMGESRNTALRCFIASLVTFFQQWTGTNAINYFSPQIFAGLGVTGTTAALFATGIYGVVKVVSVILVLLFAIESFGRKKCLIFGALGQAATMFWIGGYSGIHKGNSVDAAGYVSIIAIYLYAVFFSVGWGPVPWILAGEISPNYVRSASLSLSSSVTFLMSITISKLTPIMLNDITYGTFLVFGSCCVIMAVWAYFGLPETSGYALEDIKFLFGEGVRVRALEDAPGGRWLIPNGKVSTPVAELRRREDEELGISTGINNALGLETAGGDNSLVI